MLYIIYIIEGIQNLDLIKFSNKNLNARINIYGKNNDTLEITFLNEERDIYNYLICEIFYKTNYIDKMVYSIGKNEINEPYKFFGGTPLNITKNLNKFTFNNNQNKISEIKIDFNNGTNYIINSFNNELVEFKEEEYYLICLPENILYQFKNLFLKDLEECKYNYKLFNSLSTYRVMEKQKDFFPNISFKTENNIFYLNKENAFWPRYTHENYYLFINRYPCNNFVFGLKFLELFDIREFNLENGDLNLYLDKNKNYMIANEIKNKKLLLNYSIYIIIIIFFSFFFSIILTKIKNNYKNKKIEYYNCYFEENII